MEKLRVAVIGCGSISDIYMTNITSGKFQILELAATSWLKECSKAQQNTVAKL